MAGHFPLRGLLPEVMIYHVVKGRRQSLRELNCNANLQVSQRSFLSVARYLEFASCWLGAGLHWTSTSSRSQVCFYGCAVGLNGNGPFPGDINNYKRLKHIDIWQAVTVLVKWISNLPELFLARLLQTISPL